MSNQDFFAASVNAHRAILQREARAARVARQALRAGRRKAHASKAADGHSSQVNAAARDHAPQPSRGRSAPANATAACGS
jgi:hypothetical protein